MKASLWTCGLAVALAGCSGVDRGYPSAGRGPIPSDRAGAASSWQPQGSGDYAQRSSAGEGKGVASSYADSLRSSAALAQQSAVAPLPGDPVPGRTPGTNYSPIQRVGYEERVPPLRGVPPETVGSREDLLRGKPLLMAQPDPVQRPAVEPYTHTPQRMPATGQVADLTPPAPRPMPPTQAQPLTPPQVEDKGPQIGDVAEKNVVPPTVVGKPTEDRPVANGASPPVRMLNSKRVVFNYQVQDVGPSGVSTVELWYTRDGRSWNKHETNGKNGPPYVFEVPEEGMYGFTLVARNGVGIGKDTPKPGDLPQIWVEVDLTKPAVNLTEVKQGAGSKFREVTVTWNAQDRNLARRPVTILVADKPDGPWVPLAANIENSGQYTGMIPSNGPVNFYTRVEAVDLVGNIGQAQAEKPTSLDASQPTISILGIEAGDR